MNTANLKITVTNRDNYSSTTFYNGTLSDAIEYVEKEDYENCEIIISERIFDNDGDVVETKTLKTIYK